MLRTSLAILALASAAAAQTTWYVDVNGTPPGTGTQQDPFTSLQVAIDDPGTLPGDVLSVAPGVYEEQVAMQNPANALTLRSQDGPLATTIRAPAGATGPVVRVMAFTATPTAVLEGFTIEGLPGAGTIGVQLDGGIVRECIVRGHEVSSTTGKGGIGLLGTGEESFVERCSVLACDLGAGNDEGHYAGQLQLESTVLAGNAVDVLETGGGPWAISAQHSAWQTGESSLPGSDNLVGDPGLWNATQGDPRLGPLSVCIDSGDPSLPLDADGSPADRGAVPYHDSYVPAPSFHCSAETHTGGCAAVISLKGGSHASLSAPTQFRVEATQVIENAPGILIYGTAGRTSLPFMGGELCVLGPIQRTPGQFSNANGPGTCKGYFLFDFNAWLHTPVGSQIQPGTMVNAQYWFRDNGDAQWGAATTDAVEFAVAP